MQGRRVYPAGRFEPCLERGQSKGLALRSKFQTSPGRGSGRDSGTQERNFRGYHPMLQTIRVPCTDRQTTALRYLYPVERIERGKRRGESHRQDYRMAGKPKEPDRQSAPSTGYPGR